VLFTPSLFLSLSSEQVMVSSILVDSCVPSVIYEQRIVFI
jgi:hypothetical protein